VTGIVVIVVVTVAVFVTVVVVRMNLVRLSSTLCLGC
jgi:hypothetical protein